jgi:predicted metal-binding membrane protein
MRFLVANLVMCALLAAAMGMVARPGVALAGAITLAVGLYELSPLKAYIRKHCCEASCLGLMALPMVLGMTGLPWMVGCATIAAVQQALPPMRVVDATLGVGIAALGLAIIFAPNAIPAITQPIFFAAGQICG